MGGMNIYVLQLARKLAERGCEVDVFTRQHAPDDPEIIELAPGARVIHLAAGPYGTLKNDMFDYVPDFVDALLDFQNMEGTRYDLIHSHYWLSGKVGMALSREWGAPHISTFHTLSKTKLQARVGEREPMLRQWNEEAIMSDSDMIVVSTEEEKKDILRLYGISPHTVNIVSPGVDVDMFAPIDRDAAREKLGIPERHILLYAGRVEPLKGIDILIRAASLMEHIEHKDGLRIIIVGGKLDGDAELDRLDTLARELGIRESVTFVGSVPQRRLRTYYSAADAFVLPSHSESFGLAALEAMACGTPVVVSRVGGLKTFVKNGANGYLVPWRCPESFARRLDTLLANPDLRRVMGRAARADAMSMSWTRAADRMLTRYETLLQNDLTQLAGD